MKKKFRVTFVPPANAFEPTIFEEPDGGSWELRSTHLVLTDDNRVLVAAVWELVGTEAGLAFAR